MACSSPAGIASEIPSAATTPPNLLVRASISRRTSPTASPRNQAVNASVYRNRHDKQQGAKNQVGIIGQPREPLLQNKKGERPDNWTEHCLHAAQHHHDDEIA